MKKIEYDIVFFTNQPAFYKIKLYNEIAKQKKIFVIFLGEGSLERTKDFLHGDMFFSYIFLNKGSYEKRNKFLSISKLIRTLWKIKYKLIITMGWSTIEDFFIVTFSKKKLNAVVCETSIYETQLNNWKKYFKKYILYRISYAFVSGKPHSEIFETLNFKGKIIVTGGVGLYNRNTKFIERKEKKEYKYLCVARLIPVKNLEFLVETFNKNGKSLSIVGTGILEEKLKKIARNNIKFYGYIPNESMNEVYKEHDIFILASKSETWGLVVEEALANYMPVIVSDKVGCNIDMVQELGTGEIFEYNNKDDLNEKIYCLEKNYKYYLKRINNLKLDKREEKQIESFDKERL